MLQFPLAILVVFVHGFGADIDVSELHASGLTGLAVYDYIRLFFSVVIARSAVPIFFIISGYLLFLKVEEYNKTVYISKLRKRWHSLVIPYFSWIVLFILWTTMFTVGGILLHGKPQLVIFQSFALILWASALCKYPKLYGINKKLARTSFFIYALHPFILGYVISSFHKLSIIGDKVFPMSDSWYMMTFNYLASPLACILLCIAIYWFLQTYLPSFLGVMVGERKR